MNLLLLNAHDFIAPNRVSLNDYRFDHLRKVKNVQTGERVEVGLLNGNIGWGQVRQLTDMAVILDIKLTEPPPQPLPVHLVLALPRPKMLKRILQTVSAMGVKQLSLIHSVKVEKSYWQTPWLEPDKLKQHLLLGLEQAKDTILPKVDLYQRFKPFVEDVLPALALGKKAVLAHPGQHDFCLQQKEQNMPTILAIGPEGGFTDYETDKFTEAGFEICQMGKRILRVENAIPVLLGRLLY